MLSAVSLAGSSTAARTDAGSITPSATVVKNAAGTDVTANYEASYVPGKLVVAGAVAEENGKVIYVVYEDIWLTVDEAAKLLGSCAGKTLQALPSG